MKNPISAAILIPVIFSLSSCTSVKFFSDPELSENTGLRFYSAKPYLLVERNSDKEKSAGTTLIWLPDLANPQYLVLKPGFGDSELKLAFANGSLSSYGITADSRIPETISSLATLVSKSSDAVKNLGIPSVAGQEPVPEAPFDLYEIIISKDGSILKKVKLSE